MTFSQHIVRATVLLVVCAAIIALPWVVRPYRVQGGSMHPTLKDGQVVFIESISHYVLRPSRGEIMVLRNPHKPGETDIKRVIGLPGETVHVLPDRVVISKACLPGQGLPGQGGGASGAPLAPQFAPALPVDGPCQTTYATSTPIGRGNNGIVFDMFLGPHDYFVLGDDRRDSSDSRLFGAVQRENIIGRVIFSI